MLERCEEKIMKDREEKRERGESGSVSFSLSLSVSFPFGRCGEKRGFLLKIWNKKERQRKGARRKLEKEGESGKEGGNDRGESPEGSQVER